MTTKQFDEIRRRNEAGENDLMIAEALGISKYAARLHRMRMGLPVNNMRRPYNWKTRVIYTVWDAKTDEVLACGTSQECATALGFTSWQTFQQMVSRTMSGKLNKYYVEKVREATDAAY